MKKEIRVDNNFEIIKANNFEIVDPKEIEKYESLSKDLNINDNSVIDFGNDIQKKLGEYAGSLIDNVRTYDSGAIGESITKLLGHINYADPNNQSRFRKVLYNIPLIGKLVKRTENHLKKYEKVTKNIDAISAKMDQSRLEAIKDNVRLNLLLEKNYEFIHQLEDHIISGRLKIKEIKDQISQLESEEIRDEIKIFDLTKFVSRLDKRVHNMILSRTSTVQSLPQVKIIQDNNNSMIETIQMSINTAIPSWKNNIVIAVSLDRQESIANTNEVLYNTTNAILESNAEKLKMNSSKIAKQNERGFISAETIKKVNESLISTMDELRKVRKEGEEKRREIESDLIKMEQDLRESIMEK